MRGEAYGPRRSVVDWVTVDGDVFEILECGHLWRRTKLAPALSRGGRRQCEKCADGKPRDRWEEDSGP